MDDEIDAAWMEDLYSGNEEEDIDTFDQTSSPSSYASAVDSEDDMVGAIDATSVEDCHSGNEEEEINTDQEDYDYSDDNSDEKVDDDVDDDCYGEASDSDTIAGDVKSYTILTEEDLRQRQEEDITKTSTVLQISKEAACLILLGYNWRASNAHEEWFADEERVRNAVGIIAGTPKVKFPGKKKFKCGICFENYTCKSLQCAGCCHLFCNSCWESYIRTSINDGPGCLMLRCPEPSCAAVIGLDMIDKLATDQDKAKYHSFLRRSYVENSRKIKWCPAPGCESAVEFDIGSGSYDVVCTCSYGFCWNCTEEAHRPVDCETVGKWILKNSSEAENTNWIIANSKPCPRCKRPIEKNQGCMHMTCTRPCKFEFCWLCLGAWSRHGERTGDFYSCNKYEEAKLAGTYDELERKREMAKQSLERYTHYYERWASNDLSREKALQSLNEMEHVHLEKLGELQRKPVTELKFILEAWEQIVECRRVLKWTYAYGYYLPEQQLNSNLLLFECLQGEAESVLEMLHKCAELELMKYIKHDDTDKPSVDFKDFREKLANVTRVTRIHFDNLVRALESGLSDCDSQPS